MEKWSTQKLADYCWTLRSDIPQAKYSSVIHGYFLGNVYPVCNTMYKHVFFKLHLLVTEKLTIYLNSAQNILLGLPPFIHVTKNKKYFVIQ